MKKFTTLCRLSPALMFNDASFHALITKSPSIDVVTAQWLLLSQRDQIEIDKVYLTKWPSVYSCGPATNNN